MAAAQAMLAAAMSHRDQAGGQAVRKIRSAISAEADSWWHDITGFFSSAWGFVKDHWVPLLKDLCTVLEILATVLAIVCLFIPGLDIVDVLLMAAFGATILATIGRGVLAATGNGSWLDFGLDFLACLTFGLSTFVASPALANAAEGALDAGKGLVAEERASTAAEYMTKFFGSTRGSLIGQGKASELAAKWAAEDVPDLPTEAGKVAYFTKFGHAIKAGGGLGDYGNSAKLANVYARYGSNPDIAAAAVKGQRALAGLRISAATSWSGALSGLVGSGGEIDNMQNAPAYRLTFPGITAGWDRVEHFATKPVFSVAGGGGG